MNFPQEIKNKRLSLNESQLAFGDRFQVSSTAVSLWESGKRQAPYEVLSFVLNGKEEAKESDDWNVTIPQKEFLLETIPSHFLEWESTDEEVLPVLKFRDKRYLIKTQV